MNPEQPNFEKKNENIECAVIVFRGEIFKGTSHPEIILEVEKKYPDWSTSSDEIQDAFITNTGRVVDRQEAGKIAKAAMQLEHLTIPTQAEAEQNFDSEDFPTNWIRPNLRNEVGEIQRVLQTFLEIEPSKENILKLVASLEASPIIELTDELWSKLENTESYYEVQKGDFEAVENIIKEHNEELPEERKRSVESIINGFHNNNPMEVPTIIENEEGRLHLISGNTRLMTARALGIRPQVIIAKLQISSNIVP